jgi:D-inositol-3-phosphate glycosyltransferase
MPEGSLPARDRNVVAKRIFDRLLTRTTVSHAFRVIATSAGEADDLWAWGVPLAKTLVLAPRADVTPLSELSRKELRRRWALPPENPVLLWLGRMMPVKGLDRLFDALGDPRLAKAYFLIGGSAEDPILDRRLRDAATKPPLGGRVRFVGWVDAPAKSELLKLADLFVFPSIKENFGLAVAEAIASGLPAVVSEGSGISRIIGNAGAVVCKADPRALADAIAHALTEPGLLTQLRQGTTVAAERLQWPPLVEQVEHIYREAIDAASRS